MIGNKNNQNKNPVTNGELFGPDNTPPKKVRAFDVPDEAAIRKNILRNASITPENIDNFPDLPREITQSSVMEKHLSTLNPEFSELSHIQDFLDFFERGKKGKNVAIPMGFNRLTKYVGIRRQVYYLLGGFTGSGKTTLLDDAFVLNPISWFFKQKKLGSTIDLKILYWSMERSKKFKIARWLARTIFKEEGVIIDMDTIFGFQEGKTVNTEEERLIRKWIPFINKLFDEVVTLFEGPTNPTGFYKEIQAFAEHRGKIIERTIISEDGRTYQKKVYVPDNPDEIVILIADPIQLTKPEKKEDKTLMTEKQAIEKLSEYFRHGRDFYGYTPVAVSQFNREISNPIRLKNGDVQPQLEDFSSTSATQNDAEVIMALFDPMRYKVADIYGYDLSKLREGLEDLYPGSKKYRQVSVLKNSYGADDVGVGLAYQPQVGLFKELPYADKMTDADYRTVIDNSFFFK